MSRKSDKPGKSTSAVEVTNISARGFWLLVDGRELFLSFVQFPWFREASVGAILKVKRPTSGHLYWPELDIDLALESIEQPARYPLVSRARPNRPLQQTGRRVTPRAGHGSRRSAGR